MHTRYQRWIAVVIVVTAMGGTRAYAQAPSDRALAQLIYKTINLGVSYYNNNDAYGCYRLWQGHIMTLIVLNPQRPQLVELLEAGLAKAEAQKQWALRATVLRETLDEALASLNGQTKPLWERLGGEPTVKAVVHEFILLAASDPKVDFTRGGKYPIDAAGAAHLEKLLVELVSTVSGGPLKYTGRDMKSSHAGMAITNVQFDAIATDLITVLNKYKVPPKDRDELVNAIAATRKDIVEVHGVASAAPAAPSTSVAKPLFERLGGERGITALVEDFFARAATDTRVNFTRRGTTAEWRPTADDEAHLKKSLVDFIAQATGGPAKYQGKNMKLAHKGMAITREEFSAIAADLKTTLEKYSVPRKDQEELLKIVGSTAADIIEQAP